MRAFLRELRKAARVDAHVLLTGETGAGKTHFARAIHVWSQRVDAPFVAFEVMEVSPSLVESELFGHTKGAFTGAHKSRAGALVSADRGTIFLDEIGDMSLDLQPKLLAVLQSGFVRAVGADRKRKIDVRIVAATNRDLAAEVTAGRFRADLYYRIGVVTIAVPPLRERRNDIVPLFQELLAEKARANRRSAPKLADDGVKALRAYHWPGNVRQLANVAERCIVEGAEVVTAALIQAATGKDAAAQGGTRTMGGEDVVRRLTSLLKLPPSLAQEGEALIDHLASLPSRALEEAKAEFERFWWRLALERHGWNQAETARATGVSRRTVHNVLRKHFPERLG